MGIRILAVLAVVALTAQPVLAQTPASKTTTVSIASLLSGGYEVKVITDVSTDEQKVIWPNDAVSPYIMVTLQKGGSLAVCTMSMLNWVTLADATLTNATLCKKY